MEKKSIDEFFKGRSDAEWDRAEAIEAEIMGKLSEGLPEDADMAFVRAVMEVQAAIPAATVEGVFAVALHLV